MNKKYFSLLLILVPVISLLITSSVLAATSTPAKKVVATSTPVTIGQIISTGEDTINITARKLVGKVSTTTTYSVDTTNAKILQGQKTLTTSDLKKDDTIIVRGEIKGSTISALSIMVPAKAPSNPTALANGKKIGLFARIGNFFSNLFR